MIRSPALLALAACSLSAADPIRLDIPNGDMTAGADKPAGWTASWTGRGKIRVTRDTTVFHTAPAALKVESVDGPAQGNGCCALDVASAADIELTGWIRTEGAVAASVMVQAFGSDWSKGPLAFIQLAYRHSNQSHDWSAWSKRVTLPAGTAHLQIGLLIEGEGKAWLDDVRDVQAPAFADREATAKPLQVGGFTLAAPPEGDPAATELPAGKPWIPGWCRWNWRAAWVGTHRGFVANTLAQAGKIDVVFYGDSITQGWGDGVKALDPALRIVNYGIGGDSTRQILYRASHGELDGISPKLVVLAIGTNNLYDDANQGSDEEIATGIATCVQLIRAKVPQAKILVCAILPRQNDWFCGRAKRINALTAKLDDGTDVRVLDMWADFHDPASPNRVKAELFAKPDGKPDWLHIGPAGYQMWAERIKPLFSALTR